MYRKIFLSVSCQKSGSTDNYVGSDREGWGYLANKAIWHNKGKMCTYGELFREGDRIGVSLDMDCGTIAFTRNGKDLGVAVEGLTGDLYPAFSLYNLDDQVTLIPSPVTQGKHSSASKSSKGGTNQKLQLNFGSTARRLIDDLHKTTACLHSLANGRLDMSLVSKEEVVEFMTKSMEGCLRRHKTVSGDMILLDTSIEACRPFGFVSGETVLTPKEVSIIGSSKGMLWWRSDGDTLVSSWSRKTCREMRVALGPKPGQSHGDGTSNTSSVNNGPEDTAIHTKIYFSKLADNGIDVEALAEMMVKDAEEPWLVNLKNFESECQSTAALLYLLNHKLEHVLPLAELWRDGYSLSASGISPRAGLSGLMTNAPPLNWNCGYRLIKSKKLVFLWTKVRLLRALINNTSTQGPPTKIRLALSRGNLDLESVFRQLRVVSSADLRCGVQFVTGHAGDREHHEQSACFDLICDAVNEAQVCSSNLDLIGELIGLSLRTQRKFCVELSDCVWEALCNPSEGNKFGIEIRLGLLKSSLVISCRCLLGKN